MVGGILWATGNILTVPIINCIGLSLGLLIWGGSNLIVGWAVGRFGMFGLRMENDLMIPWLNYLGITLARFSMGTYLFVRSEVSGPEDDDEDVCLQRQQIWRHNHPLLGSRRFRSFPAKLHVYAHGEHSDAEVLIDPNSLKSGNDLESGSAEEESNEVLKEECKLMAYLENLPPRQKRLTGCAMAALAGCLYGLVFVPSQYLTDNHLGSKHGIDYVFSQFCGIYAASTFYYLVYCIVRRNRPIINNQLVLPAFGSGLLWAIGQISFFVANENLELVVSYPIIATGPGLVGSLWGIFFFKEIRGFRNLAFLTLAFALTVVGVICISLSKIG
jgi:hypothetical protein